MKKTTFFLFLSLLFFLIFCLGDISEAVTVTRGEKCFQGLYQCAGASSVCGEKDLCCNPSLALSAGLRCYCDAECYSGDCGEDFKCISGGGSEGGCVSDSDCTGTHCTAGGLTFGEKCSLDPSEPDIYRQCVPDSENYWCEESCCNSRCQSRFGKPGHCSGDSCICEDCVPAGGDCSTLSCCEGLECCSDNICWKNCNLPDNTCERLGGAWCPEDGYYCEGEDKTSQATDAGSNLDAVCCVGSCKSGENGNGGDDNGGGGASIELENPLEADTFEDLVEGIINFVFILALAVVPLMVIIGALYLITAGGNPARVDTGKKIIFFAMLGFAIVLLAKGLIALLKNILGVKQTETMIPLFFSSLSLNLRLFIFNISKRSNKFNHFIKRFL